MDSLLNSPRLEASFALWEVHVCKPSTYVLKPPKLVALREVARDNIYRSVEIGMEVRVLFWSRNRETPEL